MGPRSRREPAGGRGPLRPRRRSARRSGTPPYAGEQARHRHVADDDLVRRMVDHVLELLGDSLMLRVWRTTPMLGTARYASTCSWWLKQKVPTRSPVPTRGTRGGGPAARSAPDLGERRPSELLPRGHDLTRAVDLLGRDAGSRGRAAAAPAWCLHWFPPQPRVAAVPPWRDAGAWGTTIRSRPGTNCGPWPSREFETWQLQPHYPVERAARGSRVRSSKGHPGRERSERRQRIEQRHGQSPSERDLCDPRSPVAVAPHARRWL